MGCRKIIRVLEVFAKQIEISIPHHTTVRQWVIRNGCYNLQLPLEKADDWVAIGDLTISLGKMKCLAILGVRMSNLEKKENLILTHSDVEVLGLYPTEKSDGEFVHKALNDSVARVGGKFLATVIDRGSDIKKGTKSFQLENKTSKILHDIAHKLSNLVERDLRDNVRWKAFIQELNTTRKRAFQTELAAIMPAKQREKARFMNIGFMVNWPEKVLSAKANGRLNSISEERFQDYLGWIVGFKTDLEEWCFVYQTVGMISEIVRTFGASMEVYRYLKIFFEEASIDGEKLQKFVEDALNIFLEEVLKLDEGQTLICSTEVLESIFGKYKAINEGVQGVTGNVLGICTFVGPEKDEGTVKKTMEKVSVKEGLKWIKDKVGTSMASLRRQFFNDSKETKIDKLSEVSSIA